MRILGTEELSDLLKIWLVISTLYCYHLVPERPNIILILQKEGTTE